MFTNKKIIPAILLILAMLLMLCSCDRTTLLPDPTAGVSEEIDDGVTVQVTSTEKFNFNFSSTAADSSAWTQACKHFAEMINKHTNGNITITVYPNEQLAGGDQVKGMEYVINGTTPLHAQSSGGWTTFFPEFSAIALPFMYENVEQAYGTIEEGTAGYDYIVDTLKESGLVLIALGESGMRQLTTNKKVETAADFQNLLIRVPTTPVLMQTFTALKANPTVMNFSEIYTSLQQGVIDAQENPYNSIESGKFYEVQDYLVLTNHNYDPIMYVMNEEAFNSMPEDYQQLFLECGRLCAQWQVETVRGQAADQLALFEKYMKVSTLSETERENCREATKSVYEEFIATHGQEVFDLFVPRS